MQTKFSCCFKWELLLMAGQINRLFTITNMAIKRFSEFLTSSGQRERYTNLLINHFNLATVEHWMCRSLISVGWNGKIYDCDSNQMLDIGASGQKTIWDVESFDWFANRELATTKHCFGCTAGAGSSCAGSLQ